jgi:predicted RNA-binding Zn ribbon-like protein
MRERERRRSGRKRERNAIDSASSLRERISNHVNMIDIGERVRGDERERAKEKW